MESVQNNLKQRNLEERKKELASRKRGPVSRIYDEEPANPAGFPVDLPDTKNLTSEEKSALIREVTQAQS